MGKGGSCEGDRTPGVREKVDGLRKREDGDEEEEDGGIIGDDNDGDVLSVLFQ